MTSPWKRNVRVAAYGWNGDSWGRGRVVQIHRRNGVAAFLKVELDGGGPGSTKWFPVEKCKLLVKRKTSTSTPPST